MTRTASCVETDRPELAPFLTSDLRSRPGTRVDTLSPVPGSAGNEHRILWWRREERRRRGSCRLVLRTFQAPSFFRGEWEGRLHGRRSWLAVPEPQHLGWRKVPNRGRASEAYGGRAFVLKCAAGLLDASHGMGDGRWRRPTPRRPQTTETAPEHSARSACCSDVRRRGDAVTETLRGQLPPTLMSEWSSEVAGWPR